MGLNLRKFPVYFHYGITGSHNVGRGASLAEEVEKLSNELAWFKRQMFGSKTEHYIPEDDTPSLFPEEESPEPSKEVQTATVSEHERKVRQPNALSEIPADLPREECVIDVPEEEREGMILIGYDESERIAYRTGLYVIHFKRAKYADPSDALRGVVTAPAPGDVFDSVSGRTRYDVSFIAKVVAWLHLLWKISTNARQTPCSPFMSRWLTGLCSVTSSMRMRHSSN